VSSTKFSAVISILLGVAAIILPYLFGTFAVMMLGGVMLFSGIVALLYVNAARQEGIPVSVFAPWVQVIASVVILVWSGRDWLYGWWPLLLVVVLSSAASPA
jgi:uncharacterized membrane protein HdeD (DUF308 family)